MDESARKISIPAAYVNTPVVKNTYQWADLLRKFIRD